jgi:Holliday junction resolvase RusA-like endonuclease
MEPFVVWLPGVPRPQGSLKIVSSAATGQPFAKNSDTTIAHRNSVVDRLQAAWGITPPLTCPVSLVTYFVFDRPKGHFGTGRNSERVRPSAPAHKEGFPDTDKLIRLVGDALTIAGVIKDDSLIVELFARKTWAFDGLIPGTFIHVTPLPATGEPEWAIPNPLR